MITYLIIDDEPIAHTIIKRYCDLLPKMQLMANCFDAIEALDYLSKNKVDLIFLDLNMPKLKGFDFLKTLPLPPKVIVTTAYNEFAVESYELNVVDYLLKPFSFERFLKAVNKVANSKDPSPQPATAEKLDKSVFFYSDKKYVQVKIKEILFIEAAGNYCKVFSQNEILLVRDKLSDILETLSANLFIQVHKSFIVSKDHIHSIEGNRILILEHKIPIGSFYKANVVELLK